MHVIALADALELMSQTDRSGNPISFSIEFITWNKRGEQIGRKIHIRHVELVSIVRGKPIRPSTGFNTDLDYSAKLILWGCGKAYLTAST